MNVKNENYIPLYKQIERKILDNIATGKYKKGDRIPTQKWFVETYGVSRVTVRQAVNELTNRNILNSQKGGGTFVNDVSIGGFTSNLNRISGFTSNLNRNGQSARSKILSISNIECDKFLGEALGLSIGSPIVSLQRLRKVNDVPVSVEKSYINKSLFSELDFLQDFNDTTSLYDYIVNTGGVQLFHASENIFAVTAERDIANLLNIEEGKPVLYIKRKVVTREKETIEYCEIHCRTDIYMFSVDYFSQQ